MRSPDERLAEHGVLSNSRVKQLADLLFGPTVQRAEIKVQIYAPTEMAD